MLTPVRLCACFLLFATLGAETLIHQQPYEYVPDPIELAARSKNRWVMSDLIGVGTAELGSYPKESLTSLARRPESLFKTAELAVLRKKAEEVIEKVGGDNPDGNRLVAAMYAVDAMIQWAQAEVNGSLRIDPTTAFTLLGGRAEKLPVLIESEDVVTSELALLAAALGGGEDLGLAAAVTNNTRNGGLAPGARVLFKVRTGMELDDEEVKEALENRRSQPKPIPVVHPTLAINQYLLPSACLTAMAMGLTEDVKWAPLLNEALSHKDIRVQQEVLRALVACGNADSVEVVLKKLKRMHWPVMVRACEFFAAHPDPRSIEVLIDLMGKVQGRIYDEILYALSCMAADQGGRQSPQQWEEWWVGIKPIFKADPKASRAFRAKTSIHQIERPPIGSMIGLPIRSQSFIVVYGFTDEFSERGVTRIRNGLKESFQGIKGKPLFNLVRFTDRILIYDHRNMTTDRSDMSRDLDGIYAEWGARAFTGLEVAYDMAGVDTIFLTCNDPSDDTQLARWGSVASMLMVMNRYRPLRVHTISFGNRGVGKGLAKIAEATDGQHLVVGKN